MNKPFFKLAFTTCLKLWPTAFLITLTYLFYLHSKVEISAQKQYFMNEYNLLMQQREKLVRHLQALQAEIDDSENTIWVEKQIIDRLGYIPEGYKKAIFTQNE